MHAILRDFISIYIYCISGLCLKTNAVRHNTWKSSPNIDCRVYSQVSSLYLLRCFRYFVEGFSGRFEEVWYCQNWFLRIRVSFSNRIWSWKSDVSIDQMYLEVQETPKSSQTFTVTVCAGSDCLCVFSAGLGGNYMLRYAEHDWHQICNISRLNTKHLHDKIPANHQCLMLNVH